jgi:uncharacterized protein (DUF305 family)
MTTIHFKRLALAAALVGSLGTSAFAQHADHKMMDQGAMQKMTQDMMPKESDPASTRAFKDADMKMMKDMGVVYSGKADVDFVRKMIPHHQGAIDMAQVELAHGTDPQLKKMAQKIIDDQKKEISQMQDWLKKNSK